MEKLEERMAKIEAVIEELRKDVAEKSAQRVAKVEGGLEGIQIRLTPIERWQRWDHRHYNCYVGNDNPDCTL